MKTLSNLATHINWIFVITYLASIVLAQTLGGKWWYLLATMPITWLIDAKGRSQNWFFVGAIPILGLVVLLALENKKKSSNNGDGLDHE